MNNSIIYIATMIGLTLGGLLPSLWGGGMFSVSSVIFTLIGGIVGLYVGCRLNN